MAEITGKIIWAGGRREGTNASTGKSWASQEFVIQSVSSGAFGVITTNVVFSVMGADKLAQWNPQVGDEVTVGYGINAHEYNGRWYNDVRAHKYERVAQNGTMMQSGQYMPSSQAVKQVQQQYAQQPQTGYQSAQPVYAQQPQGAIQAAQQYSQQAEAVNFGVEGDTKLPF